MVNGIEKHDENCYYIGFTVVQSHSLLVKYIYKQEGLDSLVNSMKMLS